MGGQIKTALLSYGLSGKAFHAPFIHAHPGFHLHSILERTKNVSRERYPDVHIARNLEEILFNPDIELVIVNTPNPTHVEYASKCLQAGKHVIVEKPFTATEAEGETLLRLSEQKGLLLSVFQNRRWDSDFLTVQAILKEGWLGDLAEAYIHFDRFKPELSPKTHKETAAPGVGLIYDLGSHIIDQALVLFGLPQALFADIRTVRPFSEVDDCFELLLYYDNLRVKLHSSLLVKEQVPAYMLHGKKGSFLKSRSDIQEAELMAGKIPGGPEWGIEPSGSEGLLHCEKDGESLRLLIPGRQGNYMHYFEGIFQSIRNQKPLPVTGREGLNVIRIIEAALKSQQHKKVVAL